MENRYVIDSVGLINYFNVFFEEAALLSAPTRRKLDLCFDRTQNSHKLIIPSTVLLEIFRKFLITEEKVRKFYYEIFTRIIDNENIEIKGIEKEVLEIFQILNDFEMENNDKLIYSSAIQLNCSLISNDPVIIKYNSKRNYIPFIIF